jgi:LPS export ABC transporter permease LptG
VAARAEGEVKPRVFFEDFPDVVLYVREVPKTGGWNDVFLSDNRAGVAPAVYLAKRGRVHLNRDARTVEMVLEQGSRHTADAEGKYEVFSFDRLLLSLNPETVFPRSGPQKGEREMSIPELRARVAELESQGLSPHNPLMEIQKKFSIPFACLVFGLIGLALGVSNRRDGKLASFVVGILVISVYYAVLISGQSLAKGHMVAPWLAVWLPNFVLGAVGGMLFLWRDRAADRPLRISAPGWLRRTVAAEDGAGPAGAVSLHSGSTSLLPMSSILDRYVSSLYLRVLAISAVGMAGLFYISTFLDVSDKLFKGTASWDTVAAFFWYITPQYVYYVIPMSVLLAALVTVGILTKNSELIVMKACGISLYRVALPMLAAAVVAGGVLFGLEQTVLGPSNRRAEEMRHIIRGGSPQTFDVLNRRWMVGERGQIYHYNYFDPRSEQLNGFSSYEFGTGMQSVVRRDYAERAVFLGGSPSSNGGNVWRAEQGWTREFDEQGNTRAFRPFTESPLTIEPASYFATKQPDPDFMSYSQLKDYIERLRTSGFDVSDQQVALERKVSFPFVTLIMTLIAVPFAVTTGRRGALYGIGVGIVLAISYWVAVSVFAALGAGGLVEPLMAAWAPNLLFGAGAAYLLLTVRT